MGIVGLSGLQDQECKVFKQLIVIGDAGEGDRDGLVHSQGSQALGDAGAGGFVGDLLTDLG
jgi:hypothetical protein